MFSTGDTIVAIATPPGRGGIGVVRISGPDARQLASGLITHAVPLEPRRATLTTLRADVGDQLVATYFSAPHSYTGEDVVELSAHGSPVILRAIVSAAMAAGARLAEPGEFTLRAFLNGRIDLPQAEAVADLVDAVTPLQARAAFDQLQGTLTRAIGEIDSALFDLVVRLEASVDFPDEGYHFLDRRELGAAIDTLLERTALLLADSRRGRLIREGLQVAIVGKPNVGKSSVFNVLAGTARAIVTEIPGTTRDLVTESVDVEGLRVTLVDTAGQRETTDVVEAEGVMRAKGAEETADLVIVLLDRSRPLDENDRQLITQTTDNKRLIVINKGDLEPAWGDLDHVGAIGISAVTGAGFGQLRKRIAAALDVEGVADRPMITNLRHVALVERAREALTRARVASADDTLSEEFVLADLQEARSALEEVTGRRASEAVLTEIFSRFCIGK